jgi:hypothetical protein
MCELLGSCQPQKCMIKGFRKDQPQQQQSKRPMWLITNWIVVWQHQPQKEQVAKANARTQGNGCSLFNNLEPKVRWRRLHGPWPERKGFTNEYVGLFYPTIFKSPLTLNYIPWSKVPKDTVHIVALPAMGFHGPLRKRKEGLRLLRLISGKVWIDFIEKPTMPDYFKHYSAVQLITDAWSPTGCNWRSTLAGKLHGCGQNKRQWKSKWWKCRWSLVTSTRMCA